MGRPHENIRSGKRLVCIPEQVLAMWILGINRWQLTEAAPGDHDLDVRAFWSCLALLWD
jgi:hypothetical protein